MKLLIQEYLRGLKERGELDVMLPDVLSELGFNIISRPAVGVRQYGVDVAAVGLDSNGVESVFLFSIKSGDLNRTEWCDNSIQALRPSLEQVRDAFIPNLIPRQYQNLPIIIVLTLGGEVHQGVQMEVNGYLKTNATKDIAYQIWNGDKLSELLMTGILGAELMPEKCRSEFRKSIALIDEPEASVEYYRALLERLTNGVSKRQKDRILVARQINLCLWILYVWSRETGDDGNLEAPYLASELSLLYVWKLASPFIARKTKQGSAMSHAIDNILALHVSISMELSEKYLKHASTMHGLSSAVRSSESIDINRKLFEILGRLSLCGIWVHFLAKRQSDAPEELESQYIETLDKLSTGLADLINNNPVLSLPLEDRQSTDISLACIYLRSQGLQLFIGDWISQIVQSVALAVANNTRYPCCLSQYRDLLDHPKSSDKEYFEEATVASILHPTLALWIQITGNTDALQLLADLLANRFEHTTLQLWVIGDDSEEFIYDDSGPHGFGLTGFNISADGGNLVQIVEEECANHSRFKSLSAVSMGAWPIPLVACRHYQLPIPPDYFMPISDKAEV